MQGVDFYQSRGPVRPLRSSILRSWEVSRMREELTREQMAALVTEELFLRARVKGLAKN